MSAGQPNWGALERMGKLPANRIDKIPHLKELEDLKIENQALRDENNALRDTIKKLEKALKKQPKQENPPKEE